MRSTTSGAAFAAANAAMIRGVDGASTVHVLLADCLGLLGADTAGVLVRVGDQGLELLAATSHHAVELELYQSQVHSGPCVETIECGHALAAGDGELHARWPDFGRAMSAAGFQTVLATPMRWHERVLGGMNLFWHASRPPTQEERELAQAFADISTLALMQQPTDDDPTAITEKLRAALQSRVVIERAKGVLSQTDHLEMDEAFARLVELSDQLEQPLAQVAHTILDEIVTPRR
jgi:GAF domain-containing protein